MKAASLALGLFSISLLVRANPHARGRNVHDEEVVRNVKRNIVTGNISASYDFIICGGGLAGLVLASRLSEDANHTVLVLEAGQSGDAVADQINIPDNAYFSSLLGSSYDWQFQTTPQSQLQNRVLPWPRGKVLGGSSAVNGMYLVRPSELEVNTWQNLLGGAPGSEHWGWDNLFAYMKKSESFTPPSADVLKEGSIEYDAASHGTNGPIHASYPGTILPIVGEWTDTLDWIGIAVTPDAYNGTGWGGFIATSSINPANWTRSYSRVGYIDPLPYRPNLQILPGAMVTKLLFGAANSDGTFNATGVQYQTSKTGAKHTITVNKEVILSGGAIGSPAILMQSGVGPAKMLTTAGVNVTIDLPGVGQHMQDHLSGQVVFKTTVDTAASIHGAPDTTAKSNSFINSAIAYANITDLFGDWAPTFQQELQQNLTYALANGIPSSDPTVIAGYKAIYNALSDNIIGTRAGQVELLFSLTGTSVGGSQSIAIQAALQHPFSAGQLWITNNDPWTYPTIDPWYLSHPADILMLREGLKLARTLGVTQPLNATIEGEISPGPAVSTDDDWDAWLTGIVGTEYHPGCTCAMLPKELGGVVDPNLRVYGLANVRVADASVFPIEFAAHLQAPTYGLAEIASDLIRNTWNGVTPPLSTTTVSGGPQSTGGSSKNAANPKFAPSRLLGYFLAFPGIVGSLLL